MDIFLSAIDGYRYVIIRDRHIELLTVQNSDFGTDNFIYAHNSVVYFIYLIFFALAICH